MQITIYHNPNCGTSRNALAAIAVDRRAELEQSDVIRTAATRAFNGHESLLADLRSDAPPLSMQSEAAFPPRIPTGNLRPPFSVLISVR